MIIKPTKYIKKIATDFYVFRERSKGEDPRYQTISDDGHNSMEFYNLDSTLSLILYSYIMGFRHRTVGYPGRLSSDEEWLAILDDMAEGFKTYYVVAQDVGLWSVENRLKVDRGFELFSEWFGDLWI